MAADPFFRLRREAWGFAIGSLFFMVGAVPLYAGAVGATVDNLTFFIGALSVAGAVFLILEMSHPYSGVMQISSAPMRAVVADIWRTIHIRAAWRPCGRSSSSSRSS